MQPYQQATEEQMKHQRLPGKVAAVGASVAGGYAARKILPFLSKFISSDMEVKGLNKVEPRLGGAVQHALDLGYSQEEINEYAKSNLGLEEESKNKQESTPAKQNRNIIEQYAPDLHNFITDLIKKGKSPIEAAAMATLDQTGRKSFKKHIEKLTKDHKTPWSAIVESIYGSAQQPQINPQDAQKNAQMGQPVPSPQQQQPAQSNGGLDPAVAQILQQGQAILQRFKG